MKKSFFTTLFAMLMLCSFAQQQTNKTAEPVKHRVVLQMTSSDTLVWKSLMNNIKNLKAGWGDSVNIEVVIYGPGIEMLIMAKTTQQKMITRYKEMGIVFLGCENTMRERKIPRESLIAEAGTVPMGIGEIIVKQEQGWSYLKVGF